MRTLTCVNCPACKYQIHVGGSKHEVFYGNPNASCPKCGATFLDPWVIELAFFPKEWYVKHHRHFLVMALIFLSPLAIFFLLTRWSVFANLLETYSFMLLTFPVLFIAAIVILCVYIFNTTRISVDEAGFDKSYKESEDRLSDPAYREHLVKSGYYKEMLRSVTH